MNIGDPVRFTSELQRIKMRGNLRLWDTYQPTNNYNVNNYQLTSKTNIDPVKLKLGELTSCLKYPTVANSIHMNSMHDYQFSLFTLIV